MPAPGRRSLLICSRIYSHPATPHPTTTHESPHICTASHAVHSSSLVCRSTNLNITHTHAGRTCPVDRASVSCDWLHRNAAALSTAPQPQSSLSPPHLSPPPPPASAGTATLSNGCA